MFNLDTLNENQQRAVTAEPGPVLVISGAGTGKTRTLTHRIAYLIKTNVVKPEEILAITFTNKAASEMNERVEQLLGESQGNEKPFIGTFHRFCNQFLRKEAHHAGRIHGYAIYGASEQRQLVSNIMKKMVDKTFKEKISNCLIEINRQKMRGISPEEYAELPHANEQIVQVYKEYELALIHQNAMDFEDLLAYTNKILTEHPEVCAKYQDRFKAILVDEYQDTNAMQYSIVKNLARRDQNIFAVGDFDQTIYSWRGANVQNILQFEDDFKNTQVVRLEENYRSTKRILDCANHLITFNKARKPKELRSVGDEGDYPSYVVNFDEKEEAEYVSQTIQNLVKNKEFTFNDVAVLYRTNAQSRAFEEVMNRSTVPHRIVGSQQFYQRQEIKDLVAILQCVANPSDNLAFQFAIARPVRGVGAKAIEILSDQSKQEKTSIYHLIESGKANVTPKQKANLGAFVSAINNVRSAFETSKGDGKIARLIDDVMEATGYRAMLESDKNKTASDKLENIEELKTVAKDSGDDIVQFLSNISLMTDLDQTGASNDSVTLMTLHHAKGLEFPVVFIVGVEEGVFPYSKSLADDTLLEEERRLMYVGITRAEKRLFFTACSQRIIFGETCFNDVSRFVKELPSDGFLCRVSEHLEVTNATILSKLRNAGITYLSQVTAKPTIAATEGMKILMKGDSVKHRIWGTGIINSIEGEGDNLLYGIEFNGEEKKLMAKYAPLEKIET